MLGIPKGVPMKVTIIGAGYVGLSTGVTLAYLDHDVTFLDVDSAKIDQLSRGELPIYEPGLKELFFLVKGKLHFTGSYSEAVQNSEVLIIAVGTPNQQNGNPDLSYLHTAAQGIGDNLGEGFTVIVNKSTLPIGSGNLVDVLIRSVFESSKEKKGQGSFEVVSNPEFLREGSALHDSFYPFRVVVGSDSPKALEVLYTLYKPILEQTFRPPQFLPRPEGLGAVPFITTNWASAELIKYAANAFLSVKISFINEVGELAEKVGADITQISKGIGLDPRIGMRFLNAGIGWGGSCFGKDTGALIATGAEYDISMSLVQAAREVNLRQRKHIVDKLLAELKILKGRTVGLLGMAYKPNTDDLRDAPALDIIQRLLERDVKIKVHDPIALERARQELPNLKVVFSDFAEEVFRDSDVVILVTEWPHYRDLPWEKLYPLMRNPLILDGRNFLERERLTRLGFRYLGFGR
jgi:UDPglucose 6-dehydrogenase